ncbi:MAG: ribokinase, partial [Candidatus Limnocylindrales bacterium]
MIVVLGRPALALPSPGVAPGPAGLVAQVAIAAAAEGRSVELVGTVGDDERADELAVALGRAG